MPPHIFGITGRIGEVHLNQDELEKRHGQVFYRGIGAVARPQPASGTTLDVQFG